tara:strand:- start:51 stop:260 length:210 start_codon:yes stop_codon:yes gene_type:complete
MDKDKEEVLRLEKLLIKFPKTSRLGEILLKRKQVFERNIQYKTKKIKYNRDIRLNNNTEFFSMLNLNND